MKCVLLTIGMILVSLSAPAQTLQLDREIAAGRYNQDLAECQSYASQVNQAGDVLAVAPVALISGVGVGQGVAAGAAYTGAQNQQEVLNNCMRGRGYSTYY
jgi:hypothetical protein